MRANEILSEISFGGKIPGLDEPILGQGSGAVVPGGAAMPAVSKAAADAAAATRAARQAQATQAAQSQMVPSPASPKVTFGPRAFEPSTPAVFRRPEGRTTGGFDPAKSTSAQSDMERAKQYFGFNPDRELLQAYTKARSSGQIPPTYTQTPSGQTPSDAAKAADARALTKQRLGPAVAGSAGVGIGAGAYVGSKEQPATGTSTATPPFNDGFKSEPAPGQAAASKAAADALKNAPQRDRTQINELGPVVIPYLAGLGAAGLGGTVGYQMFKPSKPASVQPSSAAARPAPTTPAPAARPAAAVTPAPTATTRPAAAATPRPAGGPRQGVVGSQLAKLSGGEFAKLADRLNQAKVDQVLGKGKFTAGTAAANTALLDYFKDAAIRQELERRSQGRVSGATVVAPAGGVTSNETPPRVGSPAPAGSTSGGDSAPWDTSVPASDAKGSSSGNSSDNTVKSGTGLTWTDSSDNPIKFGVDETALQRLMTLSGQRH